jgi:hypothetical protein
VREFWASLRAHPDFGGPAGVETLQQALQLAVLARNHLPLVERLQQDRREGRWARLRDLAGWTEADWRERTQAVGLPPEVPGRDEDERHRVFASWTAAVVEAAFPTTSVIHRLTQDQGYRLPFKGEILAFASKTPDFDFRRIRVDSVPDTALSRDAKRELKRVQRAFHLAPDTGRYATMRVLLERGLDSAQRVRAIGRSMFVRRHGAELGGESRTMAIYDRSVDVSSMALTLAIRFGHAFDVPRLPVLPHLPDEVEGMPEWRTLFGSPDFCECVHCRSVLSPAAYLVDLLVFLDGVDSSVERADGRGMKTGLEILLERRPDLDRIELSCENTNTPLPAIDLLNEVLEDVLAGTTAPRQTSGRAEDLRVQPEHVNTAVYGAPLTEAVHPWILPFHLWTEEARVYLAHLGVPRWRLVQAFSAEGSLASPAATAERLGLNAREWAILADDAPASLWRFWGLARTGNAVRDPDDPEHMLSLRWVAALRRVPVLLARAGLTCEQLTEALRARFLNPEDRWRVDFAAPVDGAACDLERATVVLPADEGAAASVLNRLHRFLRLQKRLGWSRAELDGLLRALGASDIPGALVALSHAGRLKDRFTVPVLEIAAWYGPLDTAPQDGGTPSFYEALFLSKTVLTPEDRVFRDVLERPAEVAVTLGDRPAALSAAFRLSGEALAGLLAALFPGGDAPLSLERLSVLYRHVSLARALGLSLPDFLSLRALVAVDPFAGPADTLRFADRVDLVRTSGFSVAELEHLLRHQDRSGVAPLEANVAQALSELQEGLRRVADEHPDDADLRDALSRGFLAQKLSATLGTETATARQLLERLTAWRAAGDPARPAYQALLDLATDGGPLTEAARPAVFRTFARIGKARLIVSRLKISARELDSLLRWGPAWGWLNLDTLPASEGDPAASFDGWAGLAALFRFRDRFEGQEPSLFDVLDRIAAAGPDAKADVVEEIARLTGWPVDGLEVLLGPRGEAATTGLLAVAFPEGYRSERLLVRLAECFALLRTLGASAAQAGDWARPEPDAETARTLRQAVKAKYDEAGWREATRPLQDALRERRRDALVAGLFNPSGRRPGRSVQAAYDDFLLDPEISACVVTSRIKQAISSVQLFVQRTLMGLEPGVALLPDHARRWEWMKNYRIWEANRKVFLWPENVIEPELRDDRSPFFRDLENQLLQGDVTPQAVEAAVRGYLARLDEVARLEVAGLYRDEMSDTLHVFGRTRNTPHLYYYRRRERAVWTAWEKVDLDIAGDHLIPVMWSGRLYLFWPIFEEKAKEDEPPPENAAAEEKQSKKYWTIKLAWAEYGNGRWSARKVAAQAADTLRLAGLEPGVVDLFQDRSRFFFKAWAIGSDLHVACFLNDQGGADHIPVVAFVFAACGGEPALHEYPASWYWLFLSADPHLSMHQYLRPSGARVHFMSFAEGSRDELELVAAEADPRGIPRLDTERRLAVLGRTPGEYRLVAPSQFLEFVSQAPFFYEDRDRTFFVTREAGRSLGDEYARLLASGDYLDLGWFGVGGWFDSDAADPRDDDAPSPLVEGLREALGDAPGDGPGPDSLWDPPRVPAPPTPPLYRFRTFHHPYVCRFVEELHEHGVDGLLNPPPDVELSRQAIHREFFLEPGRYDPDPWQVALPYPVDDVDFSEGGAYALYNWELFFHIPLLIAARLGGNQKFEAARRWFHVIFDPTDVTPGLPAPARFWKLRPFHEEGAAGGRPRSIEFLLELFHDVGDDPALRTEREGFQRQVDRWKANPFNPHLVARLRPTAYQKTVVMKYLDNLIAWGDQLFRQDTLESINEATLLYVTAARILGERPREVPAQSIRARTYRQLVEAGLDPSFSNALVEVEDLAARALDGAGPGLEAEALPDLRILYFCVPPNEKLLGYWDTIADRLFKIRHCMDMEGRGRTLPLFEPPIEPGLLVRARAAGVDLASALADVTPALPHYRFGVMLQKALEICAEVKGLGQALLTALEKRDAEELALLRSTEEIRLLDAVRDVRQKQVDEARETLESLRRARRVVEIRHAYYRDIEFLSAGERTHLDLTLAATLIQTVQQLLEMAAAPLSSYPEFYFGGAGWAGSPLSFVHAAGGSKLATALGATSRALGIAASISTAGAALSSTMAGYGRRRDEWNLQEDVAAAELDQIDRQILAAEVRQAIAQRELENHDLQRESARGVNAFMREKFTSRELYDWMATQVSTLYFQAYQLAYDTAKRAERAYRFELGIPESSFVRFGYWDNLKKGLLAGEGLAQDLRRLEAAYLEENQREFEITKPVSLAMWDPVALIRLRETGRCVVTLPEALFDLDYPGHYMRRIKSVSLTLPCLTGPYTNVNCTLTLTGSVIRSTPDLPAGRYLRDADDPRFRVIAGPVVSIVTSSGQNDAGLFDPSLRDERYLPFEGAGAESTWQIELERDHNLVDVNTLVDVILHLRFTARDGGEALRTAAREHRRGLLTAAESTPVVRLLSLRHDFSGDWHRFLHPVESEADHSLFLDLAERLPSPAGRPVRIARMDLFLKPRGRPASEVPPVPLELFDNPDGAGGNLLSGALVGDPATGQLPHAGATIEPARPPGRWRLRLARARVPDVLAVPADGSVDRRLDPEALEDIFAVLRLLPA